MDEALARRALRDVQGLVGGAEDVDPRYDSVEEAMRAYAHLAGYLLALLAHARVESLEEAVVYVERMLDT